MVVYTAKFLGQDRIIVAHDGFAVVVGDDPDCGVEVTSHGEFVSGDGTVSVDAAEYTELRELK